VSAAADSIVPLGLTDPHAASFTPQGCRSVHDITRFCHEMAVREMFEVNRNTRSRRMSRVCRLAFTVPLETFVIDLGGGLATGTGEQSVRPEEIASVPFRALIAGMSTPGLPWSGAVPIELRGFAGLVLNSMIDNERAAAELGSDAYVLVSERYVNYSARMGYHFASLDAYASASLHRNYISYRFKGGAAAAVRRVRRARFIAYVLRHWGFSVVQRVDHVDATIRKLPEPEVLALLRELGRLLGAVRNADVSMYSDDQVELYAEAFLAGACSPVDATQGKLRSPPR
jgi:pyruvate,water dikinase